MRGVDVVGDIEGKSREVDVVVVGAGAAGCVVAARLSRAGARVLLVERGQRARSPWLHVPKGFYLAMQDPRLAYHYPVRQHGPGLDPAGTEGWWLRGRAVGGSTAINGMMWLRGEPADYDRWAAAGCPGWSWREVVSAMGAVESHVRPTHAPPGDSLGRALLDAAAQSGLRAEDDLNDSEGPRVGPTPVSIRRGRRVSAARAFLPTADRRTLEVWPGSVAVRLTWDGDRATGLVVERDGTALTVRARHEVVLCAGTVETTLLLERSGVGDPARLAAAGVRPVVVAPRVGEGVVEQRGVTLKARVRPGLGQNPGLDRAWKQGLAGARWLLTRGGPVGTGAYELAALVDSGASAAPLGGVDGAVVLTSLSTDETGLAVDGRPGLMLQGWPVRPRTTSSIHLSGPDPDDPPVITARHLLDPDDVATTAGLLRRQRAVLTSPALADLVVEETSPGPAVEDPEAVAAHVMSSPAGIYHAVGACAMGAGDDAVVDARLRVRGATGLRVADASVLPGHVSAGTAAPVSMVGWRAADLLLEDAGGPSPSW